jgi:hypothetical protein
MSSEKSGPQRANESWLGSANYQAGSDQEHDSYMADQNEQLGGADPDVVLDVPVLNVDEIDLEVEDLRAHVSLRAELADLVKVNVGIDIYLEKVKLSVKGVEAQALLKIKLQRVLDTFDRALETIDRNPQILGGTVRDVDQNVRDADQATRGDDQGAERTSQLEEATTRQAGRIAPRTVDEPENVTETIPNGSNGMESEEATGSLADLQIEEEYVDEWGRIVGRARDETGNVVEEVLDEEGRILDPSVPAHTEDQESEENGEVEATDAARRKADELGMKLSDVRGTGSGGRVLVKDVERTAK